jgi:ABC-type molybdate transport system substrate-binding protein
MADIKVFSTHAVQEVLRELGPAFERASGVRLAISYDPANALKHKIEDGAVFDVAIVTRAVIDALAKQRKIVHESCTDIARSGLGLAVRKGAAKPDVTTVSAFKRAPMTKPALITLKRMLPLSARAAVASPVHVTVKASSAARMADDNRMSKSP